MERDEARKPLAEGVRRLLAAGVAAYDPSRPPRPRFKGLQHLQLADELLAAEVHACVRACVGVFMRYLPAIMNGCI